ncbi:hypothetical protein [Endozoicomonas arenosclerae]|uniref:hypothetical protein n=1 Tax=Endozoicomonas arenosclerae TaxID=1633495 RepID=UPI00078614ED|nr:hypothetical protein [Endozoicomonas arenosclerae]
MLNKIGEGSHQNSIEMLRDRAAGEPVRITYNQRLATNDRNEWGGMNGSDIEEYDLIRPGLAPRHEESDDLIAALGLNDAMTEWVDFYICKTKSPDGTRLRRAITGDKITFGGLVYPLDSFPCSASILPASNFAQPRNVPPGDEHPDMPGPVNFTPGQWNAFVIHATGKNHGMDMFFPSIKGNCLFVLPAVVTGHIPVESWRYFNTEAVRLEIPE